MADPELNLGSSAGSGWRPLADRMRPASLDEFVGLALAFLGGIGRRRLRGLILGPEITALGDGGADSDEKGQSGYGDVLKRSNSKS